MTIKEKFKDLSQEDKKTVLYKFAEIYSDSDELLEFIDKLELKDINSTFDIVFAGSEEDRKKLWDKEDENLKKLLGQINELNNKINIAKVQEKEFINNSYDTNNVNNFDNIF